MFKIIHGMQVDYFPDRETAECYYKVSGEHEGILNILSLSVGNDDAIYVGAYGMPSEWQEWEYNSALNTLLKVKED